MMKTKFTPGPWNWINGPDGPTGDNYVVNGTNGGNLALTLRGPHSLANAQLMASAPEMQDALEQAEACMSIVEPRSDKAEYTRILGVIRDALRSARGD